MYQVFRGYSAVYMSHTVILCESAACLCECCTSWKVEGFMRQGFLTSWSTSDWINAPEWIYTKIFVHHILLNVWILCFLSLLAKQDCILEPLCFPEHLCGSVSLTSSSDGHPVTCALCSDSFPASEKEQLLKHMVLDHKLVIADVKLIADFPRWEFTRVLAYVCQHFFKEIFINCFVAGTCCTGRNTLRNNPSQTSAALSRPTLKVL